MLNSAGYLGQVRLLGMAGGGPVGRLALAVDAPLQPIVVDIERLRIWPPLRAE
jgi:hypothetical protein